MKRLATVAGVLGAIAGAALVAQRLSDGPFGPLPGGPLVGGALASVEGPEWTDADGRTIELHLVGPADSRTAHLLVHAGEIFVACDLGFIWRRIPSAPMRWTASLIHGFKHWHRDAVEDGRVVFRIDGKRYPAQAVRVTDPERLAALRSTMEAKARLAAEQQFSAPLLDLPVSADDIWFFRLEPRPSSEDSVEQQESCPRSGDCRNDPAAVLVHPERGPRRPR